LANDGWVTLGPQGQFLSFITQLLLMMERDSLKGQFYSMLTKLIISEDFTQHDNMFVLMNIHKNV
jgi:hypothetical protein